MFNHSITSAWQRQKARKQMLYFTIFHEAYMCHMQAKKVGASSYMIDWYDLPPKKGLCTALIISISRCPIKLTAGKMLELSMYNFGCVRDTFQ